MGNGQGVGEALDFRFPGEGSVEQGIEQGRLLGDRRPAKHGDHQHADDRRRCRNSHLDGNVEVVEEGHGAPASAGGRWRERSGMALGRRNLRLPHNATPVDEALQEQVPVLAPALISRRLAGRHRHRRVIMAGKLISMTIAFAFAPDL
ncbi:hypothetical protein [Azospirillum sp. B506]|uniref:hypothetical protein n=1 Tax=Azospirillum sp. B506 TaxID=137721 RepID=UPI001FCABB2E|nr:hypothetical protein [Azospirillum sp. B506]